MLMLVDWPSMNGSSIARGPKDKTKMKFPGFPWSHAKRILFEIMCYILDLTDGVGARKRPLVSDTETEANKR